MNVLRSILCVGIVLVTPLATHVYACKVPVFRYALERWPADNYEIVALVNGKPNDDEAQAISLLRSLADANVNVVADVIDLAELSDAELWSVEGLENMDQESQLQMFYPERDGQRRLCWTGTLSPANVNEWFTSPLRENIVHEIQSGASAVWVMIDGPDVKQNAEMLAGLETALEKATASISIPEGVIRRQDASQQLQDIPGASMDDVLRCDIPLQIKFTIQRLRHDDKNELALRAMIDAWNDRVRAPFVFPVFGRGRMIEPLSVTDFDSRRVIAACNYLVGECSCSVKALNPGVDLILKTDWRQMLGDQVVMIDTSGSGQTVELSIPPGRSETPAAMMDATPNANIDHNNGKYWVLAVMALGALAFTMKLRMGVKQ